MLDPVTLLLASCDRWDQSTPVVVPDAQARIGAGPQSRSNTEYAFAPALANSRRPSPSKSPIVGGPPVPPPGSVTGPNTTVPSSVCTRAAPPEMTAISGVAVGHAMAPGKSPKSATA